MKKWDIQNSESKIEKLIEILLGNRGIKTKKETQEFLNPDLATVTVENVGIDLEHLKKAVNRIKNAIQQKEQIIVFGDYDVDGICATAILWETLNKLGAKALPYIPHRMDEGYGLSEKGVENVILNSHLPAGKAFQDLTTKEVPKQVRNDRKIGLIITVDNGIVAHDAVEYADKKGIDVIITDHHVRSKTDPKAYAIVHTTKLCGTGVAFLLAKEISNIKYQISNKHEAENDKWKMENDHLGLVALATIADLVPLLGANRTVTKFGIEILRKTSRVGLLELFKESGLEQEKIGVYEIGHVIAPRLNAMGRLEYAMESLRLLCTPNKERAAKLAELLGATNKERQLLTFESATHAISYVRSKKLHDGKLLFIVHESYQQGVIGLIAGRLVEEFYRPAIVISKGENHSKASARSIHGFNIIEFIRSASDFLINAGGHPMAAGFTIETAKIELLQKALEEKVELLITDDLLMRSLRIDCELDLKLVARELYDELQKLAPFGMGNPEPTFVTQNVRIEDMRLVGREGKHVKFRFLCHPKRPASTRQGGSEESSQHLQKDSSPSALPRDQNDKRVLFDGIGFGLGELSKSFKIGDRVDIVYVIDENDWLARRNFSEGGNGKTALQLKVKDIRRREASGS